MPPVLQPVVMYCLLACQMWVLGAGILSCAHAWRVMPGNWDNGWLRAALALSLGFGLDAVWLFALGLLGALTWPWVVGGMVLAALWAGQALKPSLTRLGKGPALILAGVLLLFVATGLFALRAPGYWDDTMYHLPLARTYWQAHQLVLAPYLRFPLFPQYMDLMLALGLMLGGAGGVLLAQGLATLPLFIASLGLIGGMRACTGLYWPGFVATVLMFLLGPVRDTLGYAYIDNGLMLFCWACLLTLAIASDAERENRPVLPWAALAGFFAGMAIGSKYFGVPLVGLAGLWLLLLTRHWRATLLYGAMALLVGGGWYLRAYVISGDPIHPAGGKLFGYFLWNASDLLLQQHEQALHGVSKNILHVWSGLQTAHVGILAWALLAVFFWPRLSRGMRLMWLTAACYFLFWFFVTQVDRYIAPMAVAGVFFAVLPFAYFLRGRVNLPVPAEVPFPSWQRGAGAVICVLLACNPFFKAASQSMQQARQWQTILDARPGYALMTQASTLAPAYGHRLVNLGFEGVVYFFDGVAVGDVFGPGRYSQMLQCRASACTPLPSSDMLVLMRKFNARMLAINTDQYKLDRADYSRAFVVARQDAHGVLLVAR